MTTSPPLALAHLALAHLALALLPGIAILAQTPTLTADVTQTLTVTALAAQQTQPVGPLPATGVQLMASGGPINMASMTCGPTTGHPPGALGFELRTLAIFSNSTFSMTGELVVHLTSPTPTSVLVTADGSAQGGYYAGPCRTELDIDNDGTVDHTWLVDGAGTMLDDDGEFGLLVGPTTRHLRIRHSSNGIQFGGPPSQNSSNLQLRFFQSASPLESYGPGCIDLTWSRDPIGGAIYECPAAAGSLAFFVFGFDAVQLPLAIAPGCFQLTNPLFAIAALPSNGKATFAQPPLALPAGVEVRVQAAVVDSGGVVRTSNGLVMTGPS